jgi:hypothetical protein
MLVAYWEIINCRTAKITLTHPGGDVKAKQGLGKSVVTFEKLVLTHIREDVLEVRAPIRSLITGGGECGAFSGAGKIDPLPMEGKGRDTGGRY